MNANLDPSIIDWVSYAVLAGHDDQTILNQLNLNDEDRRSWGEYLKGLRASPLLRTGQRFAHDLAQARWLLDFMAQVREPETAAPVASIDASQSKRFFEDFVDVSRPVKLTNMLNSGSLALWSEAFLRARYGNEQLEYNRYMESPEGYRPVLEAATLGEFLDRIKVEQGSEKSYWTAYNRSEKSMEFYAKLARQLQISPEYVDETVGDRTYFWIGPEGTRTGLHFDPYNVLFLQLEGRKKFLLAGPWHIVNAYPERDFFSPVETLAPDLHKYPRFAKIKFTEVELSPGEALLLPVGWLHQVTSLSFSVSASITKLKGAPGRVFSGPSQYGDPI